MRTLTFFLVAVFALTASPASADGPPSAPAVEMAPDSPARRDVERCLEKVGRVPSFGGETAVNVAERAERPCARANRRDESVDVGPLVRYQRAMLAWARARIGGEDRERDRARALDQRLRRVMDASLPTGSVEATRRAAAELVTEARSLRAAIDEAGPPPSFGSYVAERQRASAGVEAELHRLNLLRRDRVALEGVYTAALALEAEWHAASILLPNDRIVGGAHHRVQRFMSELGSFADASRSRDEATAERARARRFPRAVDREPRTERAMRQVFEAQGWNEPVLALHLTSAWTMERSPAGVLTGRKRDAAIGVRLADGSCRVYDFTFLQERSADGWGAMRRSSHSSAPIACENLPGQ